MPSQEEYLDNLLKGLMQDQRTDGFEPDKDSDNEDEFSDYEKALRADGDMNVYGDSLSEPAGAEKDPETDEDIDIHGNGLSEPAEPGNDSGMAGDMFHEWDDFSDYEKVLGADEDMDVHGDSAAEPAEMGNDSGISEDMDLLGDGPAEFAEPGNDLGMAEDMFHEWDDFSDYEKVLGADEDMDIHGDSLSEPAGAEKDPEPDEDIDIHGNGLSEPAGAEKDPEPDEDIDIYGNGLAEPEEEEDAHFGGADRTDPVKPAEEDSDEFPDFDLDVFAKLAAEAEQEETVTETAAKGTPDLETIGSMTEEDIERLLAAGTEESPERSGEDTLSEDDDLLSLLDGTESDDLQDIQELLQRADNNEAVDESVLQDHADNGEEAVELLKEGIEEQKTLSEKEQRAQEKKRRKQEKAAAKVAAKQAKAAAKAAAKEAKAAKKASAAAAAAAIPETESAGVSETGEDSGKAADDLFDMSLLDSIVAEANQTDEGQDVGGSQEPEETDLFGSDAELFHDADDGMDGDVPGNGEENADEPEAVQKADEQDDFGFDMDSLFGDSAEENLFGGDSSDFPDFVEPDQSEDILLPDTEENKGGRRGFLARLFDLLTEEDEEDEESRSLQLSEENRDILSDLDKEKAGKKKKKKKLKSGSAETADGEEEKGKEKKVKEKKAKKPKKEKVKKEKIPEPEPLIPERRLTFKRVMPIVLVCISFGVLIIVFSNASVDYTDKRAAREAYYEGDYQTCFENLYGKDLNETEQIMYGKSESILYIRLWMREYEMFVEEGAEVEALDSLIQTVNDYPKLYDYAVQWNAGSEIAEGYQRILNILLEKYGVTEEQAREIAAVRSDYEYTRMVVEIVQGNPLDTENGNDSASETESAPLEDALPEEEEIGEGNFITDQEGMTQ